MSMIFLREERSTWRTKRRHVMSQILGWLGVIATSSMSMKDLADTLASAGAGTSVINVTLGAPTPQSPADALGETDMVNQLIATLQVHLQKFPR